MAELFTAVVELLALFLQAVMSVLVSVLAVLFRVLRFRSEPNAESSETERQGVATLGVAVALISGVAGAFGYYVGESWTAAAWGVGIGAFVSTLGALKSYDL